MALSYCVYFLRLWKDDWLPKQPNLILWPPTRVLQNQTVTITCYQSKQTTVAGVRGRVKSLVLLFRHHPLDQEDMKELDRSSSHPRSEVSTLWNNCWFILSHPQTCVYCLPCTGTGRVATIVLSGRAAQWAELESQVLGGARSEELVAHHLSRPGAHRGTPGHAGRQAAWPWRER